MYNGFSTGNRSADMILTAMRFTIICRASDEDINVPYGLLASDVRGKPTEDDVLNIVVDEPPITTHYIDEQLRVNSKGCMVNQGEFENENR